MVQENRAGTDGIDCACVIHGSAYNWQYVENLYNMLQRNLTGQVRFHVYTEPKRTVPAHMIKHELYECPAANARKRGWWYKMQLFNKKNFAGNLLYFDLDVVILRDITWITNLSTQKFWAIRDFTYLQNDRDLYRINSSVMWWNVSKFHWLWEKFNKDSALEVKRHVGDQDYLDEHISQRERSYFPEETMPSWRWQVWEGGIKFPDRIPNRPEEGAIIPDKTSVLVFHGKPKPHELLDHVVIKQHWC